MKFVLRYDIRMVSCPKCQAVKVERVPWAETSSWFTIRSKTVFSACEK